MSEVEYDEEDEFAQYDEDNDDVTVQISNVSNKNEPIGNASSKNEPPNNIRPTRGSLPTRTKAWKSLIGKHNLRASTDDMFNTAKIKIAVDQAVADAGATSHFVLPGAPVDNIEPAQNPLEIFLPDGETIKSTHTCTLRVPWLPEEARKAHIVPGLAHTSLVSIKMLCDAGCKVTYDKDECRVYYHGKVVWIGQREPSTGLWVLPLGPINSPSPAQQTTPPTELAANAYTITSKQHLIQYLHQCLFCPPKSTLLKAIENNQLTTWPGLTVAAVKKYLPDKCPATDKGHMKRQPKGVRTTQQKLKEKLNNIKDKREYEQDMRPTRVEEKMNHLFFKLGYWNKKEGTMYVYPTGKFPLRSLDGFQVVFIVYDWTSNSILVTPIKDTTDESMVEAFEKNIEYLAERGFKPVYNIIDNVASKAIKAYLTKKKIAFQLVESYNHRANASERAIQTWKNHFVAGLCIGDRNFPLQLWPLMIEQATDTLNMMRTSRVYPKLSAYHVLEGTHDFNKHPLAPPGTRATIFNPPEIRTSWGPRAIDAWYVGAAKDHYRCLRFYIPSTGGTRISGQYNLYPQHCQLPQESPMDEAKKLATRLIAQVRKLRYKGTNASSRHVDALERLSRIFKGETEPLPTDTPYLEPTSVTPTAPTAIRQAPRVHLRKTRRNTPGRLPVVPTTISEGGRQATEGESAASEDERQSTEGEQATSEGEYTSSQEWYNTPRQTT